MLWDSIGASRDLLDVFPVRLAPASPPGLSLIPCASAGAEPGGKCGVGQLATVPSAAAVLWSVWQAFGRIKAMVHLIRYLIRNGW